MVLTNKQEEGLRIALQRYKAGEKYTVIAGFAGTGKSTLISAIIDALNLDPDKVVYATFTGKASLVLREKGCDNSITLHKLLYDTMMLSDGSYFFTPKAKIEEPYKLIVVDEASMVSAEMWNLLVEISNCHILILGDPFQLPAIKGKEGGGEDLLKQPHVFLDEVMRQAKESEIIRVTMDIRNGKNLTNCNGDEVIICSKNEAVSGMYLWADQCICATNKTKDGLNNFIRDLKGFPKSRIAEGDKLICNHNYWEISSSNDFPLVNGSIGIVKGVINERKNIPYEFRIGKSIPSAIEGGSIGTFELEGYNFSNLFVDTKKILYGKDALQTYQQMQMRSKKLSPFKPLDFSFGWAISCHRSQGSQWNKVLVEEETFPFSKQEHARWLYTAATRAIEKLVIIRKD